MKLYPVRQVDIADITLVGTSRVIRPNLGSLAHSLERLGQLQPVVVTEDLQLIAGEQRVKAARKLGWKKINATIIPECDKDRLLEMLRDENTCRAGFSDYEVQRINLRLSASARRRASETPLKALRRDCVPEIKELIDQGRISNGAARKLLAMTPDKQRAMADRIKAQRPRKETEPAEVEGETTVPEPEPDPLPLDANGAEIPIPLHAAFANRHLPALRNYLRTMRTCYLEMIRYIEKALLLNPYLLPTRVAECEKAVQKIEDGLAYFSRSLESEAYALCPECKGDKCPACLRSGFMTHDAYVAWEHTKHR